jgi:hypothetical protein
MSNVLLAFNLLGKCNKSIFSNQIRSIHFFKSNLFTVKNFRSFNNSNARGFSTKIKNAKKLKLLFTSSLLATTAGGIIYNSDSFSSDWKNRLDKAFFKDLIVKFFSKFIKTAECETKKNRTTDYEKTLGKDETKKNNKDDPPFDWGEFFRLVYQEKWYFLAAIAVI